MQDVGKSVFPKRGEISMSVREYIAAHALQGVMAASHAHGGLTVTPAEAAKRALEYADALLKALE